MVTVVDLLPALSKGKHIDNVIVQGHGYGSFLVSSTRDWMAIDQSQGEVVIEVTFIKVACAVG
jgi:hypothetical protein